MMKSKNWPNSKYYGQTVEQKKLDGMRTVI